jgi:hypothetical protein
MVGDTDMGCGEKVSVVTVYDGDFEDSGEWVQGFAGQ